MEYTDDLITENIIILNSAIEISLSKNKSSNEIQMFLKILSPG
ncbi:hypothetical protein [Clostridium sp.]|nr:hypothetical protein [Clostridium sp.]MDU7240263.1 hypothetical protein [Clostridium sp.]